MTVRVVALLLAVVPCVALALGPGEIPHWMKIREGAERVDYLETNHLKRSGPVVEASILANRKSDSAVKHWRFDCAKGTGGTLGEAVYWERMEGRGVRSKTAMRIDPEMEALAGEEAEDLRAACAAAADPRSFGFGEVFYDPETGRLLIVPRGIQPKKGSDSRSEGGYAITREMKASSAEAQARLAALDDAARARHSADAEAHRCLSIRGPGGYGAAQNDCKFALRLAWCAYRPQSGAFTEDFDCERGQVAYLDVAARARIDAHAWYAQTIHWFACRDGSLPVLAEFVPGRGIAGRCVKP